MGLFSDIDVKSALTVKVHQCKCNQVEWLSFNSHAAEIITPIQRLSKQLKLFIKLKSTLQKNVIFTNDHLYKIVEN